MHESTFSYLSPTPEQVETMNLLRAAALKYAAVLVEHLPEGPDKTYILRKHREVAMWANVCVTRHADGSPRDTGGAAGHDTLR